MTTVLALSNQFPCEAGWKYGLPTAVSYYRQVMPGKHLDGFDFHHLGHKLSHLDSREAEDTVASLVKDHDIVFTKHIDNPSGVYMLLGACDFYDKPLILDFDDDVLSSDGKEHNRYVYPEGSSYRHFLEVLMRDATAITVSTEPLLAIYRPYNKNVFLCPNAVDLADWTVKRRQHTRPTIGWSASTSHIVDHGVFEPVMKEIVRWKPEVVFSFIGHMTPKMLHGVIPRDNWEIKPGTMWWDGNPEDPRTYPSVLADLGADIGVAPLLDSHYNAARSLVKWFENTMTDTPLVASAYGPYTALQHKEDAYLADSSEAWVEAILYLLAHDHERQRIVANARARIEREYTIAHTAPLWRAVFEKYRRFRSA